MPVQLRVERVVRDIQNGQQFGQSPPLHHSFHCLQLTTNHRASLFDQFAQSVGVAGFDAASPADHSIEQSSMSSPLDAQGTCSYPFLSEVDHYFPGLGLVQ